MQRSLQFLSGAQYVEVSSLPNSPNLGETAFMNGILYIYANLNGMLTWFPLNQPQSFYIHSQGTVSTTWEIHHDLGSKDVIVEVYDINNVAMDAGIENVQDATTGEWYVVVSLSQAMAGYAVVFGRESLSVGAVDTTELHVTNRITVGGVEVATQTHVGELDTAINARVKLSDIVDDLTSTLATKPLSANQGRVLMGLINDINTLLSSDTTTLNELQEIVDYIKQNKATLDSLSISNIAGLQTALDDLTTAVDAKLDKTATAADSDKLGGQLPSHYISVDDTVDLGEM